VRELVSLRFRYKQQTPITSSGDQGNIKETIMSVIILNNTLKRTSLKLEKLENVRTCPNGFMSARCPLCAQEQRDKSGNNLGISPEGWVTCFRDQNHGFEVKKIIEGDSDKLFPYSYPVTKNKVKPKPKTKVTTLQLGHIMEACSRLSSSEELIERLALERMWNPRTIKRLAEQGDLGYHVKEWAFCYQKGMKLRGMKNGKRTFRWYFGGNSDLWRSQWINPHTKKVFITEGETDAITLIDQDPLFDNDESVVVAIPGANSWRDEWSKLFDDRAVFLIPDNDTAGQQCMEKVASSICTHAKSVRKLNWEDLISSK
jgi:hypothetical protein